ncbi:nudix hydrolase 8 [Impatiens glandulifera]|uniref:nudix hydrolase 8 n=1 Tax=Impatiens glandulifera TaxID=253017 RepID=UPI001FB10A5A|nr:nudix hydrolase 8 [Impatiens glandulifera]
MFDSSPMSLSKLVNSSGNMLSSSLLSSRHFTCVKSPALLYHLRGSSPKATYLSASNKVISSVGQECPENFRYHVHGTSFSESMRERKVLLDAFDDEYGGVIIDAEKLPSNPRVFASVLHSSLSHWRTQGKEGVWLKLPVQRSELVPIAVEEGFEYHHAERGYVMMTYWLPEGPSLLPANASHQVGVGGFVINDYNEVLVVQEKYCAPALVGFWKLPTGFINESEEIFSGVVREVKEETGVDTEFAEVVAFRHVHNVAFEKSDLFFICMLRPLSTHIFIDHLEIQAAKWMPLVEFIEQPQIQEDKMFKKIIDICLARLGKRYCGLHAHRVVSRFDGKTSFLYYNLIEPLDENCAAS